MGQTKKNKTLISRKKIICPKGEWAMAYKGTLALGAMLLLFMYFAVASPSAFPFTLKVKSLPAVIEAGKSFDFEFSVQNNGSEGTDVLLEYWIEKDGEKVLGGSDVIFIAAGETRDEQASLNLFSEMKGKYSFYIQLSYSGQKIASYRPIEVQESVPLVLQLELSNIASAVEKEPFSFAVSAKFNRETREVVVFHEQISHEGKVIWHKERSMIVSTQMGFTETMGGLPAGTYELSVTAFYGREFAKELVEFEVMGSAAQIEARENIVQQYLNIATVLLAVIIIVLVVAVHMMQAKIREMRIGREEKTAGKKLKRLYHGAVVVMVALLVLIVLIGGAYMLLGPEKIQTALDEAANPLQPALAATAENLSLWQEGGAMRFAELQQTPEFKNVASIIPIIATAIVIVLIAAIGRNIAKKRGEPTAIQGGAAKASPAPKSESGFPKFF
jgi:hypothetical protein